MKFLIEVTDPRHPSGWRAAFIDAPTYELAAFMVDHLNRSCEALGYTEQYRVRKLDGAAYKKGEGNE